MHPRDFEDTTHPDLAAPGAGRVAVRWLGTAGYELECDGVTLLIDPYLTRAGYGRVFLGSLRPDTAVIDREITAADAILVSHSHFDHVLDVPHIAARTGAVVYGSKSTANLMAAVGHPADRVVTFEKGRVSELEVGPFRIRAVPSLHSPFALGRIPYPGDIPCTCELPMPGRGYRCGEVFNFEIRVAGRTFYHLGSAALVDDLVPVGKDGIDVLLLCIAARFATPDFVPRVLRATQPRVVMPMHYDNFLRPLDRSMQLLPRTKFGQLIDDVDHFDRQMVVRTLALGGRVGVGGDATAESTSAR